MDNATQYETPSNIAAEGVTNSAHNLAATENQFSMRIENSTIGASIDHINQENLPFEAEEIGDKLYDEMIELCRLTAKALGDHRTVSDLAARAHLIQVAKTVHMPGFNLSDFGKRIGKKPSKANVRNPYLFVLCCVDESRNRQVCSNQSLALRYAVERAKKEGRAINTCFEQLSIRDCLRLSRDEARRTKSSGSISKEKGMRIYGIPIELIGCGNVIIEIKFVGNVGHFIKVSQPT